MALINGSYRATVEIPTSKHWGNDANAEGKSFVRHSTISPFNFILARIAGCAACFVVSTFSSSVTAATVTVPLDFQVAETDQGSYLSAPFQLDVDFSAIESVTLSFVVESGFDGYVGSTGNSSFGRELALGLLGPSELPPEIGAFGSGFLGRILSDVPANQIQSYSFFPAGSGLSLETGELVTGEWPSFLFDSAGQVFMTDISWSTTHYLPDLIVTDSSHIWSVPTGVSEATLTISGTVIPEPSGTVLALGLLGVWVSRRSARR